MSRHDHGRVRQAQGRLDDADSAFRATLEIWRAARGDDHPDTARAHESLAALHQRRGKPTQAVDAWDEALRILESALPAEHPRLVNAHRARVEAAEAAGGQMASDATMK